MNSVKFLCVIIFSCAANLFAQEMSHKLVITPSVGIKDFNLQWSIAGTVDGKSPNVLSELIWENLRGPDYNLKINYNLSKKVSLVSSLSLTKINSGYATDTDFAKNDRQEISSYEKFSSNKGHLGIIESYLSYHLNYGRIKIAPVVGINYRFQYLRLLIDVNTQKNINSAYYNYWLGVGTGITSNYQLSRHFNINLILKLGIYDYRADANWNLRTELMHPISFQHFSTAFDFNHNICLNYKIWNEIWLTLSNEKVIAWSNKGDDLLYLINGETRKTRLNKVRSKSEMFSLGIIIPLWKRNN